MTIDLKLPPIQQRMMDILIDGHVHPHRQLCLCIDEQATVNGNLHDHIKRLRAILRQQTHLDVVNYHGEGYRLVRLIASE